MKTREDVYIYIFHRAEGNTPEERLKRGLSQYLEENLEQLPRVERTDKGKPYFPDMPQIHFSISHSDEYWACAFYRDNVGLDIQKTSFKRKESAEEAATRLKKMADRFFHPLEAKFVEKDVRDNFFNVWTGREAYVKYTGQGIDRHFSQHCVIPKEENVWSELSGRKEYAVWYASGNQFQQFCFEEEYVGCVCTQQPCGCRIFKM